MSVACIANNLKWVPQNEIGEPLVGKDQKIAVGNIESKRDWGFTGDYVEAMWLMLKQPKPDEFVIGTGETHSVKEFLEESFKIIGKKNWQNYIKIDKRFYRPTEVDLLIADPSKARRKLNWQPKTGFKDLVKLMVEHDIKFVENQIRNNQN